ncbi:MAG TPA: Xaa-Pro peptidase family protein [Patescibacteria group bacterium]|nr:Xaa-Pro peptidase family protein [Patescibacteria group bacterium]
MSVFEKRCEKAQGLMADNGVDFLFIGGGTDLKYMTDYSHGVSERLALFVLPAEGRGRYIGPNFEMPRFEHSKTKVFFDLLPWEEWEDPVDLIRGLVEPKRGAKIALSDTHQARFITEYMKKIPDVKFVSAVPVLGEMRMHKDETEIGYLVHLGKALDKVWEAALGLQYNGRWESEVGLDLYNIKRKIFAEAGEPTISVSRRGPSRATSGINTASAHGGGGDRVIQKGDPIYWEMGGGGCMGYVGDKTRSVQVGPSTEEYRKMYEIVKECQRTAFEAVKPGVTCESIDIVGCNVMKKYGVEEFLPHRIGHGLGMDGHEYPYLVRGNKRVLEPGMVFSVEPGLYFPGKWGIRIEDIVYVTEDGAESLYHSTKEFNEVA